MKQPRVMQSIRLVGAGLGLALPIVAVAILGLQGGPHHAVGNGARTSSTSDCVVPTKGALPPAGPSHPMPAWETPLGSVSNSAWGIPCTVPKDGVMILVKANPASPSASVAAVALYLHPATASSPISKSQAEADALKIDNGPGLYVSSAIWASVTVPDDEVPVGVTPLSSAVLGRNAWVVEITTPQPSVMNYGCQPAKGCTSATFAHNVLVIDPSSGNMLSGYFSQG